MELQHVTVDVDGSRRHVRLSGKPLSLLEAHELEHIFAGFCDARADVRVVTLSTRGADFCPGADDDLDPLTSGVDPVAALTRFPGPVVATVRGVTASVGLELALAADIRVAERGSRFAMADVADGRLPCWGGTQRLPRLAGRGVAALMILAGEALDAEGANRCGVVQMLADDAESASHDLALRLDDLAPLALSAAKEALADGPELPMRHALELEGDLNHLLQTTSDRAEGLRAFFEKRSARFEGA